MKPAEVKALRARWQSEQGRDLAIASARWLAGAADKPAELEVFEGRVDLRGLLFPDAVRVGSFQAGTLSFESIAGMPRFVGSTWNGVDLSASVIRHARFRHFRIENCIFDGADLIDWRLWASDVSDSSFVGADLGGSALSAGEFEGRTCSWMDVVFDRANLSSSQFSEGVISGCNFLGSKLKKTLFSRVDMSDSVFGGLLDATRFDVFSLGGKPQRAYRITNVDFTSALFRGAVLRGYRLEHTPLSVGILPIPDFPKVIGRAVELAATEPDDIRDWFERDRRLLDLIGTHAWDYAFFEPDLIANGSVERAATIRSIYERAIADTSSAPA